ncbi:oxidoreductase, 2OG-Fe(II) oxygenase family protein [Aspergillus terreus]|uniref:Oxidoreductase, 2OG-Fe(II) oxygenase family protein n=1 Tax=Aspergillus terreus TaxID=33178 RepID=A0A5M3ZB74_ASPTE|nr:hypothetical protein ATETN484_0013019700 [Aspergillus terreus]GFF20431.1 oxidoreductase, 2OG-Fe(II) oxygenase family protein [Aspergillus terreus]
MPERSRKRRKEAPRFQKTWNELEGEVRQTIEQCKLDACLDAFLVDFYKLFENPSRRLLDLASVPVESDTRKQGLIRELEGNVNRLLPDYLDADTDLLMNEGLMEALKKSFDQSASEQEETHDESEDRFVRHMKQMAIKLQSFRLAELIEAAPTGPTPSLRDTSRKEFYRQFGEAIKDQESSSSFVCGGSIPIEGVPSSNNLLKDCTPASFGRGQEDIIDPEYRQAGKLDPSQFLTSFHPDYEIITNVERILLPSIKSQKKNTLDFRKIKAELCKLNIYSGPSGLFRKHVDTPRARDQIGSLVVCLPSAFQGGDLVVRHGGKQVNFGWSDRSASAIQWVDVL